MNIFPFHTLAHLSAIWIRVKCMRVTLYSTGSDNASLFPLSSKGPNDIPLVMQARLRMHRGTEQGASSDNINLTPPPHRRASTRAGHTHTSIFYPDCVTFIFAHFILWCVHNVYARMLPSDVRETKPHHTVFARLDAFFSITVAVTNFICREIICMNSFAC